jgi:uncharacterized membrane protein
MTTKNALLMQAAKQSLAGKWMVAAGGMFVYWIMLVVISSVPGLGVLASWIVTGPLAFGLTLFFLNISRDADAKISQIFEGFKIFPKTVTAYILMVLFILLWSLLFIIPGIITSLAYAMTMFILIDNPSLSASEALKESKRMMKGNKWKLFCLYLRFLGWALLAIIFTLGIGLFWVAPYAQTAAAKFYDDLKVSTEEN